MIAARAAMGLVAALSVMPWVPWVSCAAVGSSGHPPLEAQAPAPPRPCPCLFDKDAPGTLVWPEASNGAGFIRLVDGAPLAASEVSLSPGRHEIELRAGSGRREDLQASFALRIRARCRLTLKVLPSSDVHWRVEKSLSCADAAAVVNALEPTADAESVPPKDADTAARAAWLAHAAEEVGAWLEDLSLAHDAARELGDPILTPALAERRERLASTRAALLDTAPSASFFAVVAERVRLARAVYEEARHVLVETCQCDDWSPTAKESSRTEALVVHAPVRSEIFRLTRARYAIDGRVIAEVGEKDAGNGESRTTAQGLVAPGTHTVSAELCYRPGHLSIWGYDTTPCISRRRLCEAPATTPLAIRVVSRVTPRPGARDVADFFDLTLECGPFKEE